MDHLTRAIAEAARTAFLQMRKERPAECFYFYALYSTEEGSYVLPTAATEEGLAQTVARYRAMPSFADRTEDALASILRFSAPDSPLHLAGEDAFSGLPGVRGENVLGASIEALKA